MSDFQKQYALWDEFLTVWPASRLATMTLDEYSQAGSKANIGAHLHARLSRLCATQGDARDAHLLSDVLCGELSPTTGQT